MVLLPPENSKYQTTLAFEVIWWALQSGQVSLKSVRWHVSLLPGPLMDMLLNLVLDYSRNNMYKQLLLSASTRGKHVCRFCIITGFSTLHVVERLLLNFGNSEQSAIVLWKQR